MNVHEYRRAGLDPNFIGDGESIEDFEARQPKVEEAPVRDEADDELYKEFLAAKQALEEQNASPDA